jgi:hypothetical protein
VLAICNRSLNWLSSHSQLIFVRTLFASSTIQVYIPCTMHFFWKHKHNH